MKAKRQFGLHGYPFPKDAKGKTFFDKTHPSPNDPSPNHPDRGPAECEPAGLDANDFAPTLRAPPPFEEVVAAQ